MKPSAPNQLIEQLRAWQESNPLRAHRKTARVTLTEAATLIGVSTGTIQQWESGARQPTEQHHASITAAIGRDSRQAWRQWSSRRPNISSTPTAPIQK